MMDHSCRRLRLPFWTLMLLAFMALTACSAGATPTPAAPPELTLPATLSADPSIIPSPLPPDSPGVPSVSTPIFPVTIDYIQMMGSLTGWGIGRIGTGQATRLLRTADGGATWRDVSPGSQSYENLSGVDSDHAWTLLPGSHELWRTRDGGESWTSLGQVQGNEFWFNDPQHGWKLDSQAWGLSYVQFDILSIATTQDGGQTWQEQTLPPGTGVTFPAFPDWRTAWVIRAGFAKSIEHFPNLGVPFTLVSTLDGGREWRSQNMPLPPKTKTVKMVDSYSYLDAGNCEFSSPLYSSTTIWKFALTCEEQGWLYTSEQQGKRWTITSLPAGYVAAVQFVDPSLGWCLRKDSLDAQAGQLYQTTDGGTTWTLLGGTNWADARLDFVDDQTGWAAATTCDEAHCNPYLSPTALRKTNDGGKTWQTIEPLILPP